MSENAAADGFVRYAYSVSLDYFCAPQSMMNSKRPVPETDMSGIVL